MNSQPSEPRPQSALLVWYPFRQHAPDSPQYPGHDPTTPQSLQHASPSCSTTAGDDGSGANGGFVGGGISGSEGAVGDNGGVIGGGAAGGGEDGGAVGGVDGGAVGGVDGDGYSGDAASAGSGGGANGAVPYASTQQCFDSHPSVPEPHSGRCDWKPERQHAPSAPQNSEQTPAAPQSP